MPPPARTILHADLDAFFASVEQRDDPSLRGRPVIVAGAPPRGVVAAASYEVRRFGVRSAMPTAQALSLCPQAVVIHPRHRHYAEVSAGFFAILETYTPLVEGLSMDEAFLDVSGSRALHGDGRTIAQALKRRVREELSLVVSVGVAPNKFTAKIASDVGKPDGLVVVEAEGLSGFLRPLPVSRLWGVGAVTEKALRALGLATVGDVADASEGLLAAAVGRERAHHLKALASGRDERAVQPERAAVSIGSEHTFESDVRERGALRAPLLEHVDVCCARLRRNGRRARTVTVKLKWADHRLLTRQATLREASAAEGPIGALALALLEGLPEREIERNGVRLIGVSLSGLVEEPRQLSLDMAPRAAAATGATAASAATSASPGDREGHLGETLDRIRARFGRDTIQRAVSLDGPAGDWPHGATPTSPAGGRRLRALDEE